MKKNRCICILLSAALSACACSTGVQQNHTKPGTGSIQTARPVIQAGGAEEVRSDTQTGIEAPSRTEAEQDLADILPAEPVTLEVYSQLSSYQGEQQGWFAQILLEKFHVKLNFIYDGSEDFYSRRAESGSLGDIVIWGTDSDQYHSAIRNGLLLDWEEDGLLEEYGSYMKEHMKKALEKNRKNSDGHIYGFGYDVAAESGEYGEFDYHPDIRWDLYEKIGKPPVKELEDYVGVLKQMKEICPLSDSGQETYGVSLFSDWDGDMMMFAKSACTNFFGQDEFGVGLYRVSDGSFEGCLAEGGSYERVLRFYNELYREGLLDPQSETQGSDECMKDYQDGAAFFCIFGWLAAPQYNTVSHTADGKIMLPLAAENQNTLVYGLNENGGNRLWTIGSQTKYPQLVMALMNWLCTPQGRLTQEYGPKGVGWDYDLEKNTCLMDLPADDTGKDRRMPEGSGYSGTWSEGIPQFNNTTWTLNTVNPESAGQTYHSKSWPNVKSADVSAAEKRWREENHAADAEEYLSSFRYSVAKPNTYTASEKSPQLSETWGRVTEIIRNGSWDAVFADTQKEFEQILKTMRASADDAGYAECTRWCEKEAARRKALEE